MNYKNLTKEALPKEFQERIERFNRLFSEAGDGTFEENELFGYEMACIKQALSFAEYFKEMSLLETKAITIIVPMFLSSECDTTGLSC